MRQIMTSLVIVLSVVFGVQAAPSDFEQPPKLEAAKILPAEAVEGANHNVESEVVNDGFMNSYRIASDFGRFEAYGTPELVIRLREIGALAELAEVRKTEVYANAVKEGALRSVDAIETMAEKPVETIKGVPQGVKKLFGRTKRSVQSGYQAAKDVVEDRKTDDEDGGEGDVGEETPEKETKDEPSHVEQAGEFASDYAKKYFGVNSAQRRWSQKLGVDPYTSNEVLKKAIKEVAKVDAAGRFTARLAPIPRIPGAGTIAKVNSLVWTMDGYELMQFNKKRLMEAGAPAEAIDAFYQNIAYSPTRQTVLITSLLAIGAAENLGQALLQASTAESDEEARFFVTAARMLEWFDANEVPVDRLLPGIRALVAASDDGRIVFLAPVDYLSWTAEIAEAAERLEEVAGGSQDRELWILGDTSPRCRAELESRGWALETGVGLRLYEAAQAARAAGGETEG